MGTTIRRSRLVWPAALFAMAGLLAHGHSAVAQRNTTCPPVQAPRVTAREADNDPNRLMDFTLAVRERAREYDTVRFGCVIRQEGSSWRFNDTYIVRLTHDGRVDIHAKDMRLSGRRLKSSIYRDILKGLRIEGGDRTRIAAALIAAASGEGASFPVPEASDATATVYLTPLTRRPYVLIAGFDLDESHLAAEAIDYGNPSVTAEDVVNRATLKQFVEEAGEYLRDTLKEGQDTTKTVRLAMRDPNGPWRHGSVYVYVWDLTNRIIIIHGGFPNTYELTSLDPPRAIDVATGRPVLHLLEEALAAAKERGQNGAFVEYSFDDPNDAFDSADIPKVGYVREFHGETPGPSGPVRFSFVVGSGFYPRANQVSQSTVMETVLPRIMRSVTASTVDGVSSRIERASAAPAAATAFSLGGAATLADALQANGQALANGAMDLDRLLANSSFTLPFSVADNGGSGGEGSSLGQFTFWGSGDYRSLSGGSPQAVDYDGSVTSAHLGIDTMLNADVLAGLALSWSRGTVDYKTSGASGDVTTRLLSVNPYVGWQMPGGMNLWTTAGYGFGKVKIEDKGGAEQESDLNQRMLAAGLKGTLATSDQLIAGGVTNLNVKGEVAFTWADVAGAGSIEETALSVGRQRFVLEGAHIRKLASGATFTSSLEVGVRNDTGDGETGTGAEVGGALRYENAASRLTVEGRVRTLVSHSGDTGETGVSGLVRITPNASGHGLTLAVEPSWGRTASSVQQLWESGIGTGTAGGNQARLNGEVGYGFDAPQGLGVVTPYGGLGLNGNGSRSWRLGARWQMASDRSVSLEGTRREAVNDDRPEHGLTLRGAVRW